MIHCLQFNQARHISFLWHLPWIWRQRRLRCSQGGSKRGISPICQGCVLLGFRKWHVQSDQWYRSVTHLASFIFSSSQCSTTWKCKVVSFFFIGGKEVLAEGLSGTRAGTWHTLTLTVKVKKVLIYKKRKLELIKSVQAFFL